MKFIATITRQYEMSHPQLTLLKRVGDGGVRNTLKTEAADKLIRAELILPNPSGSFFILTSWGASVLLQNRERKKMQKSLNELISLTKKLNSCKI